MKNKKYFISVIILTYNEEIHLERLMKNIVDFADEIFIVDSFSMDKTLDILRTYADCTRTNAEKSQNKSVLSRCGSVKVVQHKFENQAQQFNWALDNLEIKNDWILRLDADEYLTEELKEEISFSLNPLTPRSAGLRFRLGFGEKEISSFKEVNGYYIKRRVYFMGQWIKHGGYYPTWILRLFKKGKARSEQREMDEHLVLLEGVAGKLKNDFIDDNKKDLTWWTEKHNNYASREAAAVLAGNFGIGKKKFFYKLPLFFRVCLYFCYRYFIRLGFLDGKEGLVFHFLQGFWYRFLVDAKIYEKLKNKNSEI